MTVGSGILALLVLGGAALLLFALVGVRRLVDLVPMSAERREVIVRAAPAVGAALVIFYAVFAAGLLIGDTPGVARIATAVVALLVIVAGWPAIRDVASGVVLKTGRACRVGDYVRIDGIKGRIQRLGLRTLTLETSTGDQALVPYPHVARETLFREPAQEHAAHHVFRVEVPRGTTLSVLKDRVRIAAIHVHWHSVARDPQMSLVGDRTLEVTVFPIHPDRGPDIETAVRSALGSEQPATRIEVVEKPS